MHCHVASSPHSKRKVQTLHIVASGPPTDNSHVAPRLIPTRSVSHQPDHQAESAPADLCRTSPAAPRLPTTRSTAQYSTSTNTTPTTVAVTIPLSTTNPIEVRLAAPHRSRTPAEAPPE